MKVYLDTSALVKLVQREPESAALRRWLRRARADVRVTSALARTELVRPVLPGGPAAVGHARRLLGRLYIVSVDRDVLDRAGTLDAGVPLRSLDAIHLATAQAVGTDIRAVLTYDRRMAAASTGLALPVATPA